MMGFAEKSAFETRFFLALPILRRRFTSKWNLVARVVVELIGEPSRLESRL